MTLEDSILGHHDDLDNGVVVTVFKADGIPEAGHLSYSMLILDEKKKLHYMVNWDGYTANRLTVLGAEEHTKFTDDELLEIEYQLLTYLVDEFNNGTRYHWVERFINLEGVELKLGSLIETK